MARYRAGRLIISLNPLWLFGKVTFRFRVEKSHDLYARWRTISSLTVTHDCVFYPPKFKIIDNYIEISKIDQCYSTLQLLHLLKNILYKIQNGHVRKGKGKKRKKNSLKYVINETYVDS